jgi:hypothetical protein
MERPLAVMATRERIDRIDDLGGEGALVGGRAGWSAH